MLNKYLLSGDGDSFVLGRLTAFLGRKLGAWDLQAFFGNSPLPLMAL